VHPSNVLGAEPLIDPGLIDQLLRRCEQGIRLALCHLAHRADAEAVPQHPAA
jgi:hypothetical protein